MDEHGTAHLSVVGPNLICPFIFLLHQKKRLGTLVCSITFVALLVRVLYRIRATAMTQLLWDEWKLTKFAVARPTVAHHTLQPFRQVFRAFNGADSTSGCTQWRCCGSHLDNQSGFKTHCLLKYYQIQQFGWTPLYIEAL